jgi:hypothetical protein
MKTAMPRDNKSGKSDAWNIVFNLCAYSLHWLAAILDPVWPGGMDYVKINVILFCMILPVVLIASLGLNLAWLLGMI